MPSLIHASSLIVVAAIYYTQQQQQQKYPNQIRSTRVSDATVDHIVGQQLAFFGGGLHFSDNMVAISAVYHVTSFST